MKQQGLIHIYYGDGKGKTTAAIGLGVRASGRGFNVLMLQFLKSKGSGEQLFLADSLNFKIKSVTEDVKFFNQMTEDEKTVCRHDNERALFHAFQQCEDEEVDVVILDEITDCINLGLLNKTLVRNLLLSRPQKLEVVLTGRKPPEDIMQLADYISEVKMIKHPYNSGIPARLGIEI